MNVMMPSRRDPMYWRAKAAVARARATEYKNPKAKLTMENVAHDYDAMAERAEHAEGPQIIKNWDTTVSGISTIETDLSG